MPNEKFQARLPDEFAEKIHEYREEQHMSKSEVVRSLLRSGLHAEDAWSATDDIEDQIEQATNEDTSNSITSTTRNALAHRGVLLALALFVLLISLFAARPALQTTALNLTASAIMAFLGAALGATIKTD